MVLLPAQIRLIFSKPDIVSSGGSEKRTKSDDGWLTTTDNIYHSNSVLWISAKYCSDAK